MGRVLAELVEDEPVCDIIDDEIKVYIEPDVVVAVQDDQDLIVEIVKCQYQ